VSSYFVDTALAGIGQRRALGGNRYPQVLPISLAGWQAAYDLTQPLRAPQLAEQHGHQRGSSN